MIRVFDSKDEIGRFMGEMLVEDIPLQKEKFYCVSLSGGSTPKAVYSYLADNYANKIPWNTLKVFWGDERCVLPTDSQSNYKMAMDELLDRVTVPPEQVFRVFGENHPRLEAIRYSNLVGQHLPKSGGIPAFHLMILGLGDDGHTASIFPDQQHLLKGSGLFDVANHPNSGQTRITATGRLINQSRKIIFIVTGKSKAAVVSAILEKKEGYEHFPASMVRPENGLLLWLLDEEAASGLDAAVVHNSQ